MDNSPRFEPHPNFPHMDPALEAYLLNLGKTAYNEGLTTVDYILKERLTLNNAHASVVHEGWCMARNEWWFAPNGPLAYN